MLNWRISGQRVTVVGGGRVAARKTRLLLQAGAAVCCVAPALCAPLEELVRAGDIRWIAATYAAEHLEGAALAFAATDDREVNARVAADARARRIPVNVADDPAASDFYLPAVLRRGSLSIAVSTGGRSPGLAAAIRRRIDALIGPEAALVLEVVAAVRERVRRREGVAPKASYEWLVNDELFRACRERDQAAVDRMLQDVLGSDYSVDSLGLGHRFARRPAPRRP